MVISTTYKMANSKLPEAKVVQVGCKAGWICSSQPDIVQICQLDGMSVY